MTADVVYESIFDIDYDRLYEMGIRGLFFDIDNTLEPYNTAKPSEKTAAFLNELREKGFKVGVVSNAKKERTETFCGNVIPDRVYNAGKPLKKGFSEMCTRFGLTSSQVAMIGDQLYTDIYGGNRSGLFTVLVKPIDLSLEPPFVAFKRILEKPFMRRNKNVSKKN